MSSKGDNRRRRIEERDDAARAQSELELRMVFAFVRGAFSRFDASARDRFQARIIELMQPGLEPLGLELRRRGAP